MQPKLIIDNYTTFQEMMDWINLVVSPCERSARARHIVNKLPQLKTALQIYFGDKNHELSRLGKLLVGVEIRENGIKERQNFSVFFKDLEMFSDDSGLDDNKLISKFLSILDYTNVGDIEIIKKIIFLEQIEIFDEFGIDAYIILNGKQ